MCYNTKNSALKKFTKKKNWSFIESEFKVRQKMYKKIIKDTYFKLSNEVTVRIKKLDATLKLKI